uniref:Uncharacterized protein n=1 Tax=Palpitomonas bilix TaxID=652834 RepID=A0A7S3CZ22_9EUKA|mmetsp:Transcript_15357/g.38813  ORF Transcript_15357/g.38813 Transcript_15357/m.38813 type:complete len:528 (+) Transcript_15357:529-2112(+)|eukprot:CAMPEP_0113890972 /NCGR_PEP_ID=MMETSP0780_2-20120614/14475_1 /TAXON_ID=652834 /ORGANISM="Palpitomonas bilix" /LENGTH=527 /DNA_ID=CAMNT_0000880493 /DNA_START=529 /DNA_END=2112 /DNA_ORIENTATION=- /assembly_acc=CAM_ASM_000599
MAKTKGKKKGPSPSKDPIPPPPATSSFVPVGELLAKEEMVSRLQRDIEDRNRRIGVLEDRLAEMGSLHTAESASNEEEMKSKEREYEFQTTLLKMEIQRLQDNLSAYELLEHRNAELQENITLLTKQLQQQRERYERELEDTRKENSTTKKELENVFRAKISDVQARSKERAMAEIDRDAKQAMYQNEKMAEELAEKHRSVEQILVRYDKLEHNYVEVKNKMEIAENMVEKSMQQMGKLSVEAKKWKEKYLENDKKIVEMEEVMRAMREEVGNLKKQLKDAKRISVFSTPASPSLASTVHGGGQGGSGRMKTRMSRPSSSSTTATAASTLAGARPSTSTSRAQSAHSLHRVRGGGRVTGGERSSDEEEEGEGVFMYGESRSSVKSRGETGSTASRRHEEEEKAALLSIWNSRYSVKKGGSNGGREGLDRSGSFDAATPPHLHSSSSTSSPSPTSMMRRGGSAVEGGGRGGGGQQALPTSTGSVGSFRKPTPTSAGGSGRKPRQASAGRRLLPPASGGSPAAQLVFLP